MVLHDQGERDPGGPSPTVEPEARLRLCVPTNSNAGCSGISMPCPRLPAPKLLHVFMLPDLDRAERIGEFWSYPQSRAFAELLIDAEEDRIVRAVLVGMLRDMEPK